MTVSNMRKKEQSSEKVKKIRKITRKKKIRSTEREKTQKMKINTESNTKEREEDRHNKKKTSKQEGEAVLSDEKDDIKEEDDVKKKATQIWKEEIGRWVPAIVAVSGSRTTFFESLVQYVARTRKPKILCRTRMSYIFTPFEKT